MKYIDLSDERIKRIARNVRARYVRDVAPNDDTARIKRIARNVRARARRRERDEELYDLHMARVRGNLGGTYYE